MKHLTNATVSALDDSVTESSTVRLTRSAILLFARQSKHRAALLSRKRGETCHLVGVDAAHSICEGRIFLGKNFNERVISASPKISVFPERSLGVFVWGQENS